MSSALPGSRAWDLLSSAVLPVLDSQLLGSWAPGRQGLPDPWLEPHSPWGHRVSMHLQLSCQLHTPAQAGLGVDMIMQLHSMWAQSNSKGKAGHAHVTAYVPGVSVCL